MRTRLWRGGVGTHPLTDPRCSQLFPGFLSALLQLCTCSTWSSITRTCAHKLGHLGNKPRRYLHIHTQTETQSLCRTTSSSSPLLWELHRPLRTLGHRNISFVSPFLSPGQSCPAPMPATQASSTSRRAGSARHTMHFRLHSFSAELWQCVKTFS